MSLIIEIINKGISRKITLATKYFNPRKAKEEQICSEEW